MLKQGERERLRDGQEIDRAGLTLADACRVLLEAPASARRRRLFARVERSRLLAAVTAIEGLALSPDDRARELILTRHRGVRRYLPLLLDTIDFQATEAGGSILQALDALGRTAGRGGPFAARAADGVRPRAWRPLVEPGTGRIDRAA